MLKIMCEKAYNMSKDVESYFLKISGDSVKFW